ncbi:uncharacterized protein [Prorops nasuta]|uniref:uncharacterized protein n=1 Tax=Prorops nasuta TaxID=863751 RepID=UPI0034CEF0EF
MHHLRDITHIIDVDGFIVNKKIVYKQVAIKNIYSNLTHYGAFKVNGSMNTLSIADRKTASFVFNNVHGIVYGNTGNERYSQNEIYDFLKIIERDNVQPVVAYKGGHFERDLLNIMNINNVNLENFNCPKFDFLNEYIKTDIIPCDLHKIKIKRKSQKAVHCMKQEVNVFAKWVRKQIKALKKTFPPAHPHSPSSPNIPQLLRHFPPHTRTPLTFISQEPPSYHCCYYPLLSLSHEWLRYNIPIETSNDGSEFIIKNKCIVHLSTHHNSFETKLTCLIAPRIIERFPHEPINLHENEIPLNLKLADPSFNIPGQVALNQQGLVLKKTKLGWILSGPISAVPTGTIPSNPICTFSLNEKIEHFWRIENFPDHKPLSFEEKECEKIFVHTFSRDKDSRFVVNIPLRDITDKLGNSRELAELRLLNLEKRLDRQPELRRNYSEFLDEYERIGHMSLVNDIGCQPCHYLPHHCVFKSGKIRAVFDSSAPTSFGVSLNDVQMVGPNLQAPLFDILIRFRRHLYIISADVENMYRQVLNSPEKRALQRILWRLNSKEPIKSFNLNAVTYGTASASFLSVRAFFQLGYECQDEFPVISKIILNDFYADDLLTGAETVEETIFIASIISKVLNVTNIEETEKHTFSSLQDSAKTLGLKWTVRSDIIGYTVQTSKRKGVTKRKVSSEISQIFDPLGLLGPVTILAKIFMQTLCKSYTHVELHNFADTSKNGYRSDSSIVLLWIRLEPNVLPAFIANRIAQIQELTYEHEWRHVPTSMNPADALSRGEVCNWPKNIMNITTSEEVKTIVNCLRAHQTPKPICNHLLQRFSDLNKVCRILSYVRRFCNKSKRNSSEVGFVTPLEINESLLFLIKCVQMECFSHEIRILEKNQPIKGQLSRLAFFIDNRNMIRVDGRLANSHYSHDKKFPLLLSSKHELTKRIVLDEHLRSFHAGPQLLLYSVRQRFWPLRGGNLVRGIVHSCVRYFKAKPNALVFKMGNLPQLRITPSYPINSTIVIDLPNDAFTAALRTFVSRRCKPANLHSDNGTSFVGTPNALNDLGSILKIENAKLGESAGSIGILYLPIRLIWAVYGRLVLNSNDFTPLASARFLIGRTFAAVVDPPLDHVPNSRLSNWQRIQSMQQHYWKRWSKEYNSELQFRNKWMHPFPAIQLDTLVLLKEDNLAPDKWKLGRVVETYPAMMVPLLASGQDFSTLRSLTGLAPNKNESKHEANRTIISVLGVSCSGCILTKRRVASFVCNLNLFLRQQHFFVARASERAWPKVLVSY